MPHFRATKYCVLCRQYVVNPCLEGPDPESTPPDTGKAHHIPLWAKLFLIMPLLMLAACQDNCSRSGRCGDDDCRSFQFDNDKG